MFDNLTLDEVEAVEEMTGLRMDQLIVPNQVPSAKTIKAFALVKLRRTKPDATAADLAGYSYTQAIDLISGDDPKAPPAKRVATRRSAPT